MFLHSTDVLNYGLFDAFKQAEGLDWNFIDDLQTSAIVVTLNCIKMRTHPIKSITVEAIRNIKSFALYEIL